MKKETGKDQPKFVMNVSNMRAMHLSPEILLLDIKKGGSKATRGEL